MSLAKTAKAHEASDSQYSSILNEHRSLLLKVKSVRELFEEVKPRLYPQAQQFLESQFPASQTFPIRILNSDGDNWTVEIEKMVFHLKFSLKTENEVRFQLNGREIVHRQSQPIETLWEQVMAVLPKSKASKWSLLVPQSQAMIPGLLAWGLFGSLDVYLLGSLSACSEHETKARFCKKYLNDAKAGGPSFGMAPGKFEEMSASDLVLKKSMYLCQDRMALHDCLMETARLNSAIVPPHLREAYEVFTPVRRHGTTTR